MIAQTRLSYDVVDVFAPRPYAGNPLAVVHGAGRLGTAALQAMASEFNLSETAFPSPRPDGSYDVRIFTPSVELPFAGHPTIGTAWVLRQRGEVGRDSVVQHCGAGDVGVRIDEEGAELTVSPRSVSGPLDPSPWLAAVGLGGEDAGGARIASCGLAWAYLSVSADQLSRAGVLPPGWAAAYDGGDPLGGVCVYSVEADAAGLVVAARVFCPEVGVPEDPATGSAAAALGPVLVADGLAAREGETGYRIGQGSYVNRPSLLDGWVEASAGTAIRVRVRGAVVPVASGTIRVPDEPA